MKVCPVCKTTYDDDAEHCDDDGELLIEADQENLSENPELRDVLQVSPDEATSMIDLEAMEDKIRERVDAKRAADQDRAAKAMKEAEKLDPDVTGTIDLEALERKRSNDKTSPGVVKDSPEGEKHEPTLITRDGRKGASGKTTVKTLAGDKPPRDSKKVMTIALLVGGGILSVGAAIGVSMYFLRGEPLTVISVPPGATVILDEKPLGVSPLTVRAAQGSHTIELTLDGYEPFKDVIDVPAGGTSFREPLKALPKTEHANATAPEDGGTADGGTAAVNTAEGGPTDDDPEVARVLALITSGDYEGALSAIKAIIAASPDDPRGDRLLSALTDAKTRPVGQKPPATTEPVDDKSDKPKPNKPGPSDRKPREPKEPRDKPVVGKPVSADRVASARSAYEDGERAYQGGRLDDAKLRFKESIQLDPRFYLPHRSVARIYEREGNIKQARYHLQRYVDLGGPDADLKVRRWLESHP
jgi:hypothetical protein